MTIVPKRVDVHVHFDRFVIQIIETKGDMNAEEEQEVMDALDELVTLAGKPAGKETTNGK
jgi:hypothetical protein